VRKIKSDKQGNPGYIPGPMNIIQNICIFFSHHFKNCHYAAVIEVIHIFMQPSLSFRIMQIENNTGCRIKKVLKIKA